MDRLSETAFRLQNPSRFDIASPRQSATFALLHIPKCAGTSLMDSITLEMGAKRHVVGFDRCLFGDFRQFDTVPPMMRNVIHRNATDMPADAATVMGHFSYGSLVSRYPDADMAIFLREPTVRLLSHWVYWRSLTWFSLRHWGKEWSARLKLARLPLHDFLSDPNIACQTDNIAIRMLVWPHTLIPDGKFIDPADDETLLAVAREHLENIGFSGITERGAAVYREFSNWLGIKLHLPTLNPAQKIRRSARTRLNHELNPATMDLLRERFRLDNKLWNLLATRKMSEPDARKLQQNTLLQAVARFSQLLA